MNDPKQHSASSHPQPSVLRASSLWLPAETPWRRLPALGLVLAMIGLGGSLALGLAIALFLVPTFVHAQPLSSGSGAGTGTGAMGGTTRNSTGTGQESGASRYGTSSGMESGAGPGINAELGNHIE